MKRHASSHTLAVLVCTISSGILVHIGKDYYPMLANTLESVSQFIVNTFHFSQYLGKFTDNPTKVVSALILAVILAVIWGFAFSFIHSDKQSKG